MQYLLLIYDNERERMAMSQEELLPMYRGYFTLRNDLEAAGKYVGGNPLEATETATTVRVRNGKRTVTDGPFAETKEQLGGYFLVEAKDLDDAIDIAARIPGATLGSIEVRPIRPLAKLPD